MGLNAHSLDLMANYWSAVATHLALHSADPGSDGLNETTATRVEADWAPATNGGLLTLAGKAFTGGAPNGPIAHLGFWSAPVGGVFYGSGLLVGDHAFNPNGSYSLVSLTISGSS